MLHVVWSCGGKLGNRLTHACPQGCQGISRDLSVLSCGLQVTDGNARPRVAIEGDVFLAPAKHGVRRIQRTLSWTGLPSERVVAARVSRLLNWSHARKWRKQAHMISAVVSAHICHSPQRHHSTPRHAVQVLFVHAPMPQMGKQRDHLRLQHWHGYPGWNVGMPVRWPTAGSLPCTFTSLFGRQWPPPSAGRQCRVARMAGLRHDLVQSGEVDLCGQIQLLCLHVSEGSHPCNRIQVQAFEDVSSIVEIVLNARFSHGCLEGPSLHAMLTEQPLHVS
mmetsp:Transcript_52999/g.124167  ORF Transcript_52999/g.124167 Transcript_52999/m.124167 type:complete len:277 (+) Transcript_52999:416-1246(+)